MEKPRVHDSISSQQFGITYSFCHAGVTLTLQKFVCVRSDSVREVVGKRPLKPYGTAFSVQTAGANALTNCHNKSSSSFNQGFEPLGVAPLRVQISSSIILVTQSPLERTVMLSGKVRPSHSSAAAEAQQPTAFIKQWTPCIMNSRYGEQASMRYPGNGGSRESCGRCAGHSSRPSCAIV